MIAFGPEVCRDFEQAITREWLETNGLGGYASSTIIGANTRRYHALLVAALAPPTRRTVLLSKVEETLAVGEIEYDLSCNQYPGAVHPQGHRYLREFRLDPFPTFVYEVEEGRVTRLEKTVAMCRGWNAVIVRYRLLESPGTASLIVRPLVNCRDHHHLMREDPHFDISVEVSGARDRVSMKPYPGAATVHILLPGAYFESWGYWYGNFEYVREAERGLGFRESQYSPGFFTCTLDPGGTSYLVAGTRQAIGIDGAAAMEAERARRASLTKRVRGAAGDAVGEPMARYPGTAPATGRNWESAPEALRSLVVAADAFLVGRGRETAGDAPEGIVAGYHWFEEWGRDAMISLPGLTLVTGRFDVARNVLRAFAKRSSEGMIPNRIADAETEPDYNTADATLWMFWAAHKYLDYTGDREFVMGELLPVFVEAVEWHVRGTRSGIRVDGDGLLRAGEPGTQLTWMDAKVGDWVVTPREGKPVEINALWHHALRFLEELGGEHSGPTAEQVAREFGARFWNKEAGYLNDVVDGGEGDDYSLRPNQIFAVGLPYPMLEAERERRVVEAVKRDLLTPYGLRTLSPRDPRYRGRCEGDQRARDGAYHQGTVWPWLLGHFITAYVRVSADRGAAKQEARGWLEPLWAHLR
ncbi:MAG: glycogen debranching enzyme N-terminal domain-containing protein, partial [Armatimonadota bacterium]